MKKKLLVTLLAISMTSSMLTGCLPKPTYNPENDIVDEYGDDYEDNYNDELDDNMDELEDGLDDLISSEDDSDDLQDDSAEEDEKAQEKAEENSKDDADKKSQTTVSDLLSDNWTDLQFQLEGQVLTLPCDYSDIEALGYTFDLSDYGYDNGYILNPGDSTYSTIHLENEEGAEVTVGFTNTGDEAKDILECQIWSVRAESTYVDAVPDLVFPGGITWGATLETVEAVYGTVDEDDIYVSDLGYKAYSYNEDDKYMDVDIYTDDPDGRFEGVTKLEMQCY